jgi:hypothetical protein
LPSFEAGSSLLLSAERCLFVVDVVVVVALFVLRTFLDMLSTVPIFSVDERGALVPPPPPLLEEGGGGAKCACGGSGGVLSRTLLEGG